ncbi:MAG: flagellar hook capping FlgD N-terminal domain-containing protein [Mariprofundaceae bacterium]|nr:flagellar hook capping FlgD N-terminal domain-containing protein [Mariprofundaceae bacterium]
MPLQLSNVSTTNPQQSALPAAQKNLGGKDVFLKLLVAQMKNQNPEKPQDATQMSSQLAQFNMVEQQISTNKYLSSMASKAGGANGASGLESASSSYLGHNVTVNQNTMNFTGTPLNFSTNLNTDAASSQILVRDSVGQLVRTINGGGLTQGNQKFSWNGLDDNGATVPSGTYSFEIKALDYQGQTIQANVQRSGLVDAVRMTQNGVQLAVAGVGVDASKVSEVRL